MHSNNIYVHSKNYGKSIPGPVAIPVLVMKRREKGSCCGLELAGR